MGAVRGFAEGATTATNCSGNTMSPDPVFVAGISSEEAFRLTEKTSPTGKAKRTLCAVWNHMKSLSRLLGHGRHGVTPAAQSSTNYPNLLTFLRENGTTNTGSQMCFYVDELVHSSFSSVNLADDMGKSSTDGYDSADDMELCWISDDSHSEVFEIVSDPDIEEMDKAEHRFAPTADSMHLLRPYFADDASDADNETHLDDSECNDDGSNGLACGLSVIEEEG